ncbi:MAG: nuclear transport factor 2 family protein [Burkholderiales bacterium]|nr:nuclear transport factor 2 family protein [Burkholderiales bacterium]
MSRHIDTVQAIYQAFGQGNVPDILAKLAPRLQWEGWADHSAQRAGHPLLLERTDAAGVAAFFTAVGEQLEIHEFKVLDIFGSGRQVGAEVLIDCTYRSTGVRLRDEELHLWTFGDDGKVQRFRHYLDTAKHLRGAGLTAAA